MVHVWSRAQLHEKHPAWKYFGQVDRKESVMYWQRRLGCCLVFLECFPPTDLRSFPFGYALLLTIERTSKIRKKGLQERKKVQGWGLPSQKAVETTETKFRISYQAEGKGSTKSA